MSNEHNYAVVDECDEQSSSDYTNTEGWEGSAFPPSVKPGIPKLGSTPAGWRRYRLGDVLRVVERPAKITGDRLYQLVTAKRSRGGIVAREALRGEQIKTKTQFFVETGDFLISKRQISHGACGLVPASLNGALISNEYCILHTSPPLDLYYLRLLSHTTYFQQTCFHSSIGVHVEKLVFRIDDWFKWKIDLPPLEEQRRVVSLIESWDKSIEWLETLMQAKVRRFEATLARLVGGAQLSRTPPHGWLRSELGELARIRSGGTPNKSDVGLWGNHMPWLSAKDLKTFYLEDAIQRLSKRGAAQAAVAARGTVLILVRGMGLFKDIPLGVTTRDVAYNQDVKALVTGAEVSGPYLAYALKSRRRALMSRVDSAGHGTGRLSTDFLESLPISYPIREVQERIVASLDLLQRDLTLFGQYRNAAILQRKGLLKKLLEGDTRNVAANRVDLTAYPSRLLGAVR